MSGDLGGKPVVFLGSPFCYTFERHIEQAFHDAGICVLSMCRPGVGDTDPEPEGASVYETFAGDLAALLGQLGHEKCILLSSNLSATFMHHVAPFVADHVSGLFQVGGVPPIKYQNAASTVPWSKAVIRALKKSPNLAKLMITSGISAWSGLGMKQFFKVQLRKHPKELKRVLRPDALREAEFSLKTSVKQGYGAAIFDMITVYTDTADHLDKCELPLFVLHGTLDPMMSVEALRQFAQDYEHRTTFVEIPDAGFTIMMTHTDVVVDHIAKFLTDKM